MKKSLLLLLPALVFGATFATAQVVVYTQPFDNTVDATPISDLTNWGYASSSGAAQNLSDLQFGRMSNLNGQGGTQGLAYNYLADTSGDSRGNVTWFAGDLEAPADPMSLAQSDLQSLSVRIGHGDANSQTRWLVRVDTSWFVSTQKYTHEVGGAANFEANNTGISANFGDLTWGSLAYDGLINDASSGFTIITNTDPATVALPTGNITALGVYNWNSARFTSTRFDDFTITAVPEPSTYAALSGLLALGLVAWRRRRR